MLLVVEVAASRGCPQRGNTFFANENFFFWSRVFFLSIFLYRQSKKVLLVFPSRNLTISLDGVEVLGRLPREYVGRLAAEVAVGRRLEVARLGQVERARDQSRAEVEGLEHLGQDLLVRDLARLVGVDVDRQRLRDADGVRDLDQRAAGEARGDDRLGGLAGDVGSGAVDLGRVLSGEGAAAVGSPAWIFFLFFFCCC
mgnify:CR=1 FL=1